MSRDEQKGIQFQEAIDFFRQKINVPSAKYSDIQQGSHARGFTVAGATKEALLCDFRQAMDQAITQGTTLETFRGRFDQLVQQYGWDYKGTRGWRTRTIWETNLTTAFAAGRYAQMTDPDLLKIRPYWQYLHGDGVKHPRPEHLAWSGKVWAANDLVWRHLYPPNGWGCHCSVITLSRRDLAAMGKTGPDPSPDLKMVTTTLQTSSGPVQVEAPQGVDPGWGYNVGEAAQGRPVTSLEMEAWKQSGEDRWEILPPFNQASGSPIPADPPKASLGPATNTKAEMVEAISKAIGGKQVAMPLADGSTVLFDAEALAAHLKLKQGAFMPFLAETLNDPYEIWLSFQRDTLTGKVVLRKRVLKVLDLPKQRPFMLVVQSVAGKLEAWTIVPVSNPEYLERYRVGRLIWSRHS